MDTHGDPSLKPGNGLMRDLVGWGHREFRSGATPAALLRTTAVSGNEADQPNIATHLFHAKKDVWPCKNAGQSDEDEVIP